MPSPSIVLHLHIRPAASPGGREALLAFLRRARPYYESPGGIRMRLLERRGGEDEGDAAEMIEVFEYDTVADYEADERRVNDDPRMKALLEEWRGLLDGPPRIVVHRALPL
jgi:hypothetical protein